MLVSIDYHRDSYVSSYETFLVKLPYKEHGFKLNTYSIQFISCIHCL